MPTVDPGPCRWRLPDAGAAPEGADLIGLGADLEPSTLLEAYRTGLFPMHVDDDRIGWWSPDPRGILRPGDLRVTRSLRASARRMSVTVDQDFGGVIRACGSRPDALDHEQWINAEIVEAFSELHRLGWAHSIEVWQRGELVGGLYGVEIGGLFAGESMFHRVRDASKVALLGLVDRLIGCGGERLVDVQWRTEHLGSLGVVEVPRPRYLAMLGRLQATAPCLGS